MISSPEQLVQIQNNLIDLFLIMPSTKLAQMVSTLPIKGQDSRWEISLNDISWTTGPN